jgi:hypothetical protein
LIATSKVCGEVDERRKKQFIGFVLRVNERSVEAIGKVESLVVVLICQHFQEIFNVLFLTPASERYQQGVTNPGGVETLLEKLTRFGEDVGASNTKKATIPAVGGL